MRVHKISGASIDDVRNMAIARVWQLDAQYWLEFDAERQERSGTPAVMVEKWPESPARVWVLSPDAALGKRERMV